MLVMLAIAAAVMLGLGVVVLLRNDPPELSGWLRTLFGTVFAAFAIAMAALLGIPAALGLWAMAGANAEDTVPALPRPARRTLLAVAIGTVAATAVVLVLATNVATIIDVAQLALVAMGTLGLAAATSFSPHRLRAIGSAMALIVVSLGTAWMLRALI
jgi:hypothetical protein